MVFASLISAFLSPVLASLGVLATLLCVFFLVWGGLAYITSTGDPAKLQRAKRMIFRSLAGLIIVLSAGTISLFLNHTYHAAAGAHTQSLPSLDSIKPVSGGGGLVGVLIKAITGVLVAIVETVAKPFIAALNYFTKATPLLTHNASVMHLWIICTGIADSLLVLTVALIGFHVMGAEHLGLREVNLSSMLPQLLFVFVLINSSVYILDGVIELSNIMIATLRAGMGSATPWQELLKIVNGASAYSLAALIIFVIFLVFCVVLLIYYIARIVTIYLGAVLAPIIILVWLIPGFRDFAENALKTYLTSVFVLFVHVIILALAGSLFASVVAGPGGSPDPIMSLLLGLATLTALIKTQGVLAQLNFASLGPRTARRLGASFINGVSYFALSSRQTLASTFNSVGEGSLNMMPEPKLKINQPEVKLPEKRDKK